MLSCQRVAAETTVPDRLQNEILVLNDKQRVSDEGSDDKRKGEDAFLETLRIEKRQRREFAEAFVNEQAGPNRSADLGTVQQEQATHLAYLDREIARLRRSLRIAQCCGGVVLIALLWLAGYLLTHPSLVSDLVATGNSETRSLNDRKLSGSASTVSELVLAPDLEFEIKTDVDRKYQLIIRQLYNTAMTIRRPQGDLDVRVGATDDYLRYMTEVSRAIEEAAQEQVSSEIMLALSNLALVGQELRKVVVMIDLDIETQNKLDQIKSVLRARDARSLDPESRSVTGRG